MALRPALDLFIFAGEMSGDALGADLIDALPDLKIGGVGGPKMREKAFTPFFKMESFEVMGFLDVLLHLPRLLYLMYKVKRKILALNPKCVCLIDYPGFNLKLAQRLRQSGYRGKIVQYVCPSVWAWKKGRIPKMARDLDLVLSLLPFEQECFQGTQLEVEYIGHPLAHSIKEGTHSGGYITLFPGSRKREIQRNLPIQLKAARTLKEHFPKLKLGLLVARDSLRPLIKRYCDCDVTLFTPAQKEHAMRHTSLALATSGTVVLELALYSVPTVVGYALSPFDEFLATRIFKISLPHYSLPNIVAGREIFPEYYGSNLSHKSLVEGAKKILMQESLLPAINQWVRTPLEHGLGSKSAANAINKLIF